MKDQLTVIDGKELKLTNLDKVFWPKEGYTKGDLLAYYESVFKYILPYIKDRPQSLNRFPNGITGESFYQKNVEDHPSWLKTFRQKTEENEHVVNYAVCNDLASLVYIVNLGAIEINVWNSIIKKPNKPDYLVFDLDPNEVDFEVVRKIALIFKEILDAIGLKSYPKTSGKRGLHIYIPTSAMYTYEQVRNFAFLIAVKINQRTSQFTSLERRPAKRRGKVYLDYLQNRKEATMAAPYSVRPTMGALVSTPLTWQEVEKGARPEDFNIKNTIKRLSKVGDLFLPVLKRGINLERSLKVVERL